MSRDELDQLVVQVRDLIDAAPPEQRPRHRKLAVENTIWAAVLDQRPDGGTNAPSPRRNQVTRITSRGNLEVIVLRWRPPPHEIAHLVADAWGVVSGVNARFGLINAAPERWAVRRKDR